MDLGIFGVCYMYNMLKKIPLLYQFFSDQHFYIHFNDAPSFQHIDFDIVTSHANKPYKFGRSKLGLLKQVLS